MSNIDTLFVTLMTGGDGGPRKRSHGCLVGNGLTVFQSTTQGCRPFQEERVIMEVKS